MCKQIKNPVHKKACPYCGKKLQAKSKRRWRNNLARHLDGGTCLPYEAEKPARMAYMGAFIGNFLGSLLRFNIDNPIRLADPKAQADIAELEKIYSAPATTEPLPTDQAKQKDSHQS